MSKILHFSKITAFVLCAAAVFLLASCAKKPAMNPMAAMMMQAAPVRAVAAISSDVPLNVSAVGNVEAISSVDVKSRVAGQIIRVDFQEGQNVEKGQLLFEIDPEPLQRQITELQADIAKDEALEQQAHANVAKDQAHVEPDAVGGKPGSRTRERRHLLEGSDRAACRDQRFDRSLAPGG